MPGRVSSAPAPQRAGLEGMLVRGRAPLRVARRHGAVRASLAANVAVGGQDTADRALAALAQLCAAAIRAH